MSMKPAAGHLSEVIDDLLNVPERENGGRTAYDRFDFQTAWGISKVIDRHKGGANSHLVGYFGDALERIEGQLSELIALGEKEAA